nr:TetR/AcrR family transcriptional regulator [uncultured Flavobacterium sp.]
MINDTNREKIKDAAVKLVLSDGVFHPSTAEITVAAGVSRTLLHYYFKDKNEIQEMVTSQAMCLYSVKMQQLFLKDTSLYDRITEFSEAAFELSLTYPFLDSYIVKEATSNPLLKAFLKNQSHYMDAFVKELQLHILHSRLNEGSVEEFLTQLFSVALIPPSIVFYDNHFPDIKRHTDFTKHYKTFLRKYVLNMLSEYKVH